MEEIKLKIGGIELSAMAGDISILDVMLNFRDKNEVYVPIKITKEQFEALEKEYLHEEDFQNVECAWVELWNVEADTDDLAPHDFDQEMLDCINLRCRNGMEYLSKFVRDDMDGVDEVQIIVRD